MLVCVVLLHAGPWRVSCGQQYRGVYRMQGRVLLGCRRTTGCLSPQTRALTFDRLVIFLRKTCRGPMCLPSFLRLDFITIGYMLPHCHISTLEARRQSNKATEHYETGQLYRSHSYPILHRTFVVKLSIPYIDTLNQFRTAGL